LSKSNALVVVSFLLSPLVSIGSGANAAELGGYPVSYPANASNGYSEAPSTSSAGDFAGLYAGADIGVGIGSTGSFNTSGYVGGAHAGYNFQAGRIVGGAEIDTFTTSLSSGKLNSSEFEQKFLSSMRVRAGYVFADLVLYGTFGYAYSTAAWRDVSGIDRATLKGQVYGIGAEWSPIRKLGLRVEALRYDFGSRAYVTPLESATLTTQTNLLRAGVHYRF
jgi:outer membrane immunogenic protein